METVPATMATTTKTTTSILKKSSLSSSSSKLHVIVIVLGDVGRSPRMQYHTLSLLENDCDVTLIGYAGEDLIPQLASPSTTTTTTTSASTNTICWGDNDQLRVIRFQPFLSNAAFKKLQNVKVVGKLLYLAIRLISLVWGLLRALFQASMTTTTTTTKKRGKVDCVLVQNPPSIPLLIVALLHCRFFYPLYLWFTTTASNNDDDNDNNQQQQQQQQHQHRRQRPGLVIDWHNLGYTMFDLRPSHPIRRFAYWYEKCMAPLADGHFCVTNGMKSWLFCNFLKTIEKVETKEEEVNISVLHDKPPEFFSPTNVNVEHDLMMRLESEFKSGVETCGSTCLSSWLNEDCHEEEEEEKDGKGVIRTIEKTLFTSKNIIKKGKNGEAAETTIELRKDRPALVISSTSWTPDEDFGILLDALVLLDEKKEKKTRTQKATTTTTAPFSRIVVIVTGKGPQKSYYQQKIKSLSLKHISIFTMWTTPSDYPKLLGCADLGISLHTSTSGIDLPMKVLDMFGCEVPVCAKKFDCLEELVVDGRNGRVFDTREELADQLFCLLLSDNDNNDEDAIEGGKNMLDVYRKNIRGMTRWRENWNECAKHVIWKAADASSFSTMDEDDDEQKGTDNVKEEVRNKKEN